MADQTKDYDFKAIEAFWQNYWKEHKTYTAEDFSEDKPKYYALDMLPYPSGAGLHIGHPEGYTATDILARWKRAQGYNVLHPMGWDAFGLPAEQHAIATGTPPAENTAQNIDNFRKQLSAIGFSYNWEREVNTTDPKFYRWTQWIFLQLFKRGLAYVDERPVWWCEALGTALANEEVIDGKSERGNHPVVRKNLRQWVLRITAYADRLLEGLDSLDWPDSTKRQQKAWIGRSEGVNIHFEIDQHADKTVEVFTTRHDTTLGSTFIVLAPEHPLLKTIVTEKQRELVDDYVQEAATKSDLDRTELAKEKTGVFTGSYAINPISGEHMPIWVADYVLISYGTGAIMAVPGHDARDFEFAEKYNLPIKAVVAKTPEHVSEEDLPYLGDGIIINSGKYDGLTIEACKEAVAKDLEASGKGEVTINYKLRDWLFSRQRYWGEPFPIIWVTEEAYKAAQDGPFSEFMGEEAVTYKNKEGELLYALPLPASDLPLELPHVETYQPAGTGESPLANAQDWLNVSINVKTGEVLSAASQAAGGEWFSGTRETNTMPQWAGSCWYYLRYMDPHNEDAFINKDIEAYWKTPDIYIGGAEHAVLHLLYARFWHKVLHDLGCLSTDEPFPRLVHQGMILGELEFTGYYNESGDPVSSQYVESRTKDLRTGESVEAKKLAEQDVEKRGDTFYLKGYQDIRVDARAYKMSKSRGNVISPDTVIEHNGADALRLYEMFLGPLEASKPWNTKGIEGISRFLRKIWREYVGPNGKQSSKIVDDLEEASGTERILHETIKKVTDDTQNLRFNTAISQMMIFMNHLQREASFNRTTAKTFLQLLAPYAPHIAEELWARMGERGSITHEPWPEHDASHFTSDTVKTVVQVNGKVRGEVLISKDAKQEEALQAAKSHDRVLSFLEGKTVVKEIYVPGKIVNIVVK